MDSGPGPGPWSRLRGDQPQLRLWRSAEPDHAGEPLTARSYQLEYDRPGDIPFVIYDVSDPKARKRVTDPGVLAKLSQTPRGAALPAPYAYGPDVEAIEAFISNPDRQMLGTTQEAWLARTLAASVKAGKPWQVIGNEVIMARARSPKIAELLGEQGVAAALAKMPRRFGPRPRSSSM